MRGHLYDTVDAGDNWEEIATATTSLLADAARLQDGSRIIVGMNGTVLLDEGHGFSCCQQPQRFGFCAVLEIENGLLLVGERGLLRVTLAEVRNWTIAGH